MESISYIHFPREWGCRAHRARGAASGSGRGQKQEQEEGLGMSLYWTFHGKGRAGQVRVS